MGLIGADDPASLFLAEQYWIPKMPKLRIIVVALNVEMFSYSDQSLPMEFFESPGWKYDSLHQYWPEGVSDEFITDLNARPEPSTLASIITNQGFTPKAPQGWNADSVKLEKVWPYYVTFTARERLFQAFVDTCKKHQIDVIGTIFPIHPGYAKMSSYGKSGISDSLIDSVLQYMVYLETTNSNFHFFDQNQYGNHDYTDEDAYDAYHLSATGAKKYTRRLLTYLESKSLLSP